jgi:hypothetical protein
MTASLLLGIALWPIYAIIDAMFFKKRSFQSLFTPDFEAFQPMKEKDKLTVAISRGLARPPVEPIKDSYNFVSF